MRRVAITGSSGYLGSCLRHALQQRFPDVRILGIDRLPPKDDAEHRFVRLELSDPRFAEVLAKFDPDTIVHHAFVLAPLHNERKMRALNVLGCESVLQAAAGCRQLQRLCVASSATAFGGWPDNPVPLDDGHPVRARPEFRYAHDKVEVEQRVTKFAAEHPAITVSWIRPAIVAGPQMRNYLGRMLLGSPWIWLLDGVDTPLQLVHEEDVTAATCEILLQEGRGPFNIAPDDFISQTELAQMTNRPVWKISFALARWLTWLAWWSYLPQQEYPPGMLYFVRYPWIVAPNRLRKELGFTFQHSTRSTLEQMLKLRAERRRKNHATGTTPSPTGEV